MFKKFADRVNAKFNSMAQQPLFVTNVSTELVWDTYQNTFPEGTNEIFRERRVHECNTCYAFIKKLGRVVIIKDDNTLDSIWNIDTEGLPPEYVVVTDALHKLVTGKDVSSIFYAEDALAGREFNFEETETNPITWEHFYATIPSNFVSPNYNSIRAEEEAKVAAFRKTLQTISSQTLEEVQDLCATIYRGTEYKHLIDDTLKAKLAYDASDSKKMFVWKEYVNYPTHMRNTAIGSLVKDIEAGKDLTEAVNAYGVKVDPANYKRVTTVATPAMKEAAKAKIDELGLRDSLSRRHATLEDISTNNVIFANVSANSKMKDSLDLLLDAKPVSNTPKSTTDIGIEDFITNVVPKASKIEALVETRHMSNLVSLVAPINPTAPNMLAWDNNFSWSYKGEVTDALKENVKAAGGAVDGFLRFSIQWNEDSKDSNNDLDAHVKYGNQHIYFSNSSNGKATLDVDIQRPGSNTAVENITWPTAAHVEKDIIHTFFVRNYSGRNSGGFRAQIEIGGEIFEYDCTSTVPSNGNITVATLVVKKDNSYTINHKIPATSQTKTEWSINSKEYVDVSTIMLSPNHWDNNKSGNKHYFFMLDGCKNPDTVRGFYNEFLMPELRPHRKTFEMLSSAMVCEPSNDQLSGLGFSETLTNDIILRVDGRPYKVKF